MELIRKNWGLLTVAVLCLAVSVFLLLQLFGARKRVKEAKEKFGKEVEFFSSVKQKNIKLTPENKDRAQQNAESARKRFEYARKKMHKLFSINVSYDPDPYVAVRQLLKRVDGMRQRLLDAGIQLSPQHAFLSFDAYDARIGDIPDSQQMPEIFRQLDIVEAVVAIVVESKVAALNEITRPMGLERLTEDQYSYVPIRLSVTGTSQAVQSLLNRFHEVREEDSGKGHLFFVRNIESIGSQDQAPGGVLGGTGMTGGDGGRGMGGGDMGMGPGGGMGMGPGGGMDGMVGGMDGMGGGGGMDGMGAGGGTGALAMPKLLTRAQLQAFRARYVTAAIRLDLVEFVAPEQPEE